MSLACRAWLMSRHSRRLRQPCRENFLASWNKNFENYMLQKQECIIASLQSTCQAASRPVLMVCAWMQPIIVDSQVHDMFILAAHVSLLHAGYVSLEDICHPRPSPHRCIKFLRYHAVGIRVRRTCRMSLTRYSTSGASTRATSSLKSDIPMESAMAAMSAGLT